MFLDQATDNYIAVLWIVSLANEISKNLIASISYKSTQANKFLGRLV